MARWLGIDHGARRIGAAIGDNDTRVASPLGQLPAGDPAALAEQVRRWAEQYDAAGVVVGWPVNDDGSEGPQGRLAREFALALAGATGLDVRLWDERLSSFEADQRLKGLLTRGQKRRRHDAVAAAAMLEGFLAAGAAAAPRPDQAGADNG